MTWAEAWNFLYLSGKKIRRKSWEGYWVWERNTIMMHCKDGRILDIRKTDNPAFTFNNVAADDWEIVD